MHRSLPHYTPQQVKLAHDMVTLALQAKESNYPHYGGQMQPAYAPNQYAGAPPPTSVAANVAGAGALGTVGGVGLNKVRAMRAKRDVANRVGAGRLSDEWAKYTKKNPSMTAAQNIAQSGKVPKDVGKWFNAKRNMGRWGGLGLGLYGLSQVL